jgi:hypothetical protein
MIVLQLIPISLSLLLLAAHFLRAGQLILVAFTLLLMTLYAVRRPVANWILQGALVVGALEWIRTLMVVASIREAGEPWGRLAIILSVVIFINIASALLMNSRTLRSWYRT